MRPPANDSGREQTNFFSNFEHINPNQQTSYGQSQPSIQSRVSQPVLKQPDDNFFGLPQVTPIQNTQTNPEMKDYKYSLPATGRTPFNYQPQTTNAQSGNSFGPQPSNVSIQPGQHPRTFQRTGTMPNQQGRDPETLSVTSKTSTTSKHALLRPLSINNEDHLFNLKSKEENTMRANTGMVHKFLDDMRQLGDKSIQLLDENHSRKIHEVWSSYLRD